MRNILLAGVGGQGTVLASRLIAACALHRGEAVRTAETIGMAQRGGSVVSHVRIGAGAFAPLVAVGTADLLISFEPAEAVRALPYLRAGGLAVVCDAPLFAAGESGFYDVAEMIAYLIAHCDHLILLDGAAVCAKLGGTKSLNMALLGAAATDIAAGFSRDELAATMAECVKPQFYTQNLSALSCGEELSRRIK